ncbi:hypothetical protein GOP47_0016017 [Adiantum capillus-veneris]|uniref:Cytochrome c oxidase subunit 5C n=1 Tax=Adiantum capillus-veneris TaxID=13818 RepID=A0A9D4ZEI2_ADICA|nr:hypothetical protein GOP47_0016017 [Adiantum capillus-veneris]
MARARTHTHTHREREREKSGTEMVKREREREEREREREKEKESVMSLPSHAVAAATKGRPSVVKEIIYGLSAGLAGGALWKIHHLNERRKTEEFYSMLEKNAISVVVEE